MSFCCKLFKNHKSFDLPDISSLPGVIRLKDVDYFPSNGHITPDTNYAKKNVKKSIESDLEQILNGNEKNSTIYNIDDVKTQQNTLQPTTQNLPSSAYYSPTFSFKIRRKKPKKCIKIIDSLDRSNESNRNQNGGFAENSENEEINFKNEIHSPPRPLRKQISANYESLTDSIESIPQVQFDTTHTHKSSTTRTPEQSSKEATTNNDENTTAKNDSGIVSDEVEEAKTSKESEDIMERVSEVISQRKTEELLQNELSPPRQKIGRKEGVISDRIDQTSGKDITIEFFKKDHVTEELIRKAICNNDFLHNMMNAESLNMVVKAMVPLDLEANSYIIKEGDVGAQFYVSDDGSFEVVKKGETKKQFGRGEVFGELAILYQARRFASIKVTTAAKVWMLEGKIFRKIMITTGNQEREQNIKFLNSVPVLQGLSLDVLQKIGDLLKREFYPTGSTIIRQGDPGDKFYIIRGGRVTVVKKTGNENRIVRILKRGECFGEQALIYQESRLASVIANEPGTECLTIDRNTFNNYLGTIAELKKKPVDQIPDIQAKRSVINKDYDHIQLEELDVIGTLGVGGFGRVELVQYKKGQTFALKILKKYEVVNQGQIEHAFSEKETMAVCDSSFIVKLYKTYRNKKYIYFLMEACLGGDVWSQLQKVKCFDDKTAKFVTASVVEAFDYLHSRYIIYRDLKPENLMLDSEGYVKLVDFGFAKRMKSNQKTWTFAGTPEYVAPEIILNKGHDRSADYWALGILVHELLVGKPPFRGKDHMKTYNLILRGIDVVTMSSRIAKTAQNLIKNLCRQGPTERLGYQKRGIEEIKSHAWLENFEWDRLKSHAISSPLKTPIKNNLDLSNFEPYPRDRDDPPDETSGWDVNF